MDKIIHDAIPAAKRLDNVDKLDIELERKRRLGEIDLVEYAHAKRALIIRRHKEWASYCRAMGWPIEYHPLTRDPESIVTPCKPVSDEFELYPDRDDIEARDIDPEAAKKRKLHYLIFWCWVFVLSGLYIGFG